MRYKWKMVKPKLKAMLGTRRMATKTDRYSRRKINRD